MWNKRFQKLSAVGLFRDDRKGAASGAWRKPLPWIAAACLIFSLIFGCSTAALLWQPASPEVDTRSALAADYGPWRFVVFQPMDPAAIEEVRRERQLPEQLVVPGLFWPTPTGQIDPTPPSSPQPANPTLAAVTMPNTQPTQAKPPAKFTASPVTSTPAQPPAASSPLPTQTATPTPTQLSLPTATATPTPTQVAMPTATIAPAGTPAPTIATKKDHPLKPTPKPKNTPPPKRTP